MSDWGEDAILGDCQTAARYVLPVLVCFNVYKGDQDLQQVECLVEEAAGTRREG